MTTIHLKSLSNDTITIAAEAADALRRSLRGPVCLPGDPGYEEARSLWNAMIDRRPAMIVRAMGAADVIRTVRFAAEQNALLAVRGGGHNIAGNAVCDGGLMLAPGSAFSRISPSTRQDWLRQFSTMRSHRRDLSSRWLFVRPELSYAQSWRGFAQRPLRHVRLLPQVVRHPTVRSNRIF